MSVYSGRILYEDDHILAVNKLSGELTVGGRGAVCKLPLLDFLKKEYPGLQTIHRLDFETSGVVVFAKNKKIADAIIRSKFQGWTKVYRTIIAGCPKKFGVIRIPLPSRGKGNVPSFTRYRVLKAGRDISYVECEIETGRHHQIRRHFSIIGHPLIFDDEYGDAKTNKKFTRVFRYKKFFLHAVAVEFPHPVTGKKTRIEAPIPKIFEKLVAYGF